MRKMLLKHAFYVFAMLFSSAMLAQVTVTGVVTDQMGPLPGVNVLEKGTQNGTVTGFDGDFSLEVAEDATLVFSYVGFKTQEISVSGQTSINITLEEDAAKLDEVVVIGYGTTTVKDATGSVASVASEDFNGGVISSPEQLIQGKTAGVQISVASGEPGAAANVRIRGSNSIRSNNNPLFVVDGIPLSDEGTVPDTGGIVDGASSARNPLSFLNPNDIESISILKDASATAIYGSRGANGVVIVTTKSGKGSKGGVFTFNTNTSMSKAQREFDLFDADDFVRNIEELVGIDFPAVDDAGGNTDWQDVITRRTFSTENNLTYSRSYTGGNLRASASYTDQQGILEQSAQERIVGRLNLSHRFLDDKLKLQLQTSISQVNDESPFISAQAGASGNILAAAYAAPPTWPNDPEFNAGDNRLNPANILENFSSNTQTNRILLNGSAEYDITEHLSAKVNLGYDQSDAEASSFVTEDFDNNPRVTGNGQKSFNTLEATSQLLEATVNYNNDFGNVNLDIIAGYSFQDFRRQGFNSQGWGNGATANLEQSVRNIQSTISGVYQQFGYDVNNTSFVNRLATPDSGETLGDVNEPFASLFFDSFDNTDELQSYFTRAQLSINDKFLFTATVRADGSSRFGPENQYGIFPSGAFAWKMSEEDWVGDNVSTLKLRLSSGVTGNQAGLGYAQFLKRQRFRGPNIANNGTVNRPGLATVAAQNPELKWESTFDMNLGFDFGWNFDRLRGSVDVYRKETSDLLFRQNAAAPAFDPFVFRNLTDGVVINQGIELNLGYDFIATEDSNFSVDFNIAYNENVVEDLTAIAEFGELRGPGLTNGFVQRLGEGRSLFSFFMAEYTEDADGNPNFDPTDKEFVDKDGLPDITAGLSLNYSLGNFDASAFFTGQFGFHVYNNTANAFFNRNQFRQGRNAPPEALQNLSSEISTLYLERGDFVRLQNLSVGYNFTLGENNPLKSLRVSLNGQNVFLITDYSGLDPEVSSNTGDRGTGIPSASIDYTSFPRPRTFSLGINAKF